MEHAQTDGVSHPLLFYTIKYCTMRHSKFTYSGFAAVLLMAFLPVTATADDVVFCYDTGNGNTVGIGTGKKETYNVAMLLSGSDLNGKTLKSITVPFKSRENLSNLKIWMSKKLQVSTDENKKKYFAPDVMSADVDFSTDTVTYTLPEEYALTGDSLYVGYTFTVDDVKGSATAKAPVLLTTESYQGGYYIFTSATYMKWKYYYTSGSSAISVLLGNAEAASCAIVGQDDVSYGMINNPTNFNVVLMNYGAEGINNVDYSYEVGTHTGTAHFDFSTPVPGFFRAQRSVEIPLPAVDEKGTYPVKLSIIGINGKTSTDTNCESTLKIYGRDTKHCAVLEEYTGTWCGYCPRGLVGLEVMTRLYPDKFIGLSYHNSDPMCITKNSADYPSAISGYPDAFIDRKYNVDPYYGYSSSSFGIDKAWLAVSKEFSPVSVSVEADFNADAKSVTAKSTVASVDPERTVGCKVEYVLLADSLHGEGKAWIQNNYFADEAGVERNFPEPEFAKFYNDAEVAGLYYPDVVAYSTYFTNEQQALPETLVEDQDYENSFVFDIDNAINYVGDPIVQDKRNLRVVALVVSSSGEILNAAQCKVGTDAIIAGISNIEGNGKADSNSNDIFTLSGMRVNKLQPGVNVVRTSGGKTVKVMK